MNANNNMSKIQNSYRNTKIFITGSTGYVGKMLVEKILRALPIEHIYLLIREKKNKTQIERLNNIFQSPVFDQVKALHPDFLNKITLIAGDLVQPDLGMSESNRKLIIDEVNIIFHCAATVRFDEKLGIATKVHVRATRDLLALAKSMKHLKALVHVSTAFSHCERKFIGEEFYEPGYNPDKLISLVENTNEGLQEDIKNAIMGKWPNTYCFTKAIAEEVIKCNGQDLPCAIMRPSIGSVKEPIPGFIDTLNGIASVSIGCAIGLVHTLNSSGEYQIDLVPVDYLVNNVLAIGWDLITTTRPKNTTPIYNFVTGPDNPLKFKEMMDFFSHFVPRFPSMALMWYPFWIISGNDYVYKLLFLFSHLIPAYIADFAAICLGKKAGLVDIYRKVGKLSEVLKCFMTNEWIFSNKNNMALYQSMTSHDKDLFNFDVSKINWNIFIDNNGLATRVYILKDPLSTVPEAQRKYQKLKILHYGLITLLMSVFLYLIYTRLLICFIIGIHSALTIITLCLYIINEQGFNSLSSEKIGRFINSMELAKN